MGNGTSRVVGCFAPFNTGKDTVNLEFLEPLDEGLGHSFCYVRPMGANSTSITPSTSERYTACSSTIDSETHGASFRQEVVVEDLACLHRHDNCLPETTFKSISGASVSANASTARTGGNLDLLLSGETQQPAASFESTASFTAIPLQPVPRELGPLNGFMSGPLERSFAFGSLEKVAGFTSGPLDKGLFMSGPLDSTDRSNFSAPLAHAQQKAGIKLLMRSLSRPLKSAFSRTFTKERNGYGWMQNVILHPMTQFVWHPKEAKLKQDTSRSFVEAGTSMPEYSNMKNLQWAHGKAGEDRVHVVLSEEQGWLFVGIYDGFSGPDAPDFLMSNLYNAIDKELEGLLWNYGDKAQECCPSGRLAASSSVCACSDVVGEESMLTKSHGVVSNKEVSNAWSCNGYSDNRSSNEVFQVCRVEYGVDTAAGDKLATEAELGGGIIDGEVGSGNVDNKHISYNVYQGGQNSKMSGRHTDSICDANTLHGKNSTCPLAGSSVSHSRKSKHLYELLQMELEEDFKAKDHRFVLDARCGSSRDSFSRFSGDLIARDCIAQKQFISCPAEIRVGSSCCIEETGGMRETGSALGEKALEHKEQPMLSFSLLGHKHVLNRTLVGFKFRKICSKHKALQKKLFPWRYDWHRRHNLNDRTANPSVVVRKCLSGPVEHDAVLRAMARALETTEAAYADMVEKALDRNPELALMGSCVLVMLMKDQHVYVMNLGDSRVVLAQDKICDGPYGASLRKEDLKCQRLRDSLAHVELYRILEEPPMHNPNGLVSSVRKNQEISLCRLKYRAVQLSTDHSTGVEEEVMRIKAEHVDDPQAVLNERVKGQLKVTRAFGAEFLKQPRFNDALLKMFRVDYIGTSPYLSCTPSVAHHRLCSNDRFLVLSSDGLYQYLSNEEVVSHVAWFMENMPDGDPAQYLIAELLSRAAKKNGMNFHELLDIPHGDRRKYHDDVSVMVISLEGRIWRSSS